MERATGPGITGVVDTSVPRDLTAKELKRVTAFVVDDVTIPNEDMARVRSMLSDFLDNKMRDGELVAIVRTVGGKGLLEQFTSDRQILKRAVAQLGVRSIPPHLAFSGADPGRITTPPTPFSDGTATETVNSGLEFEGPGEGTNQIPRAILALSVSNYLVSALRQVPGRKNLVLLSGGLPLFDLTRSGSVVGDIGQLFRLLTDNATRSGVVISTMDVRGLKTSGAVAGFVDTPAKSALGGGTFAGSDENPNFGRSMDTARLGDRSPTEQLTLRTLASSTGGVSVVNSNNFSEGLDRVLNRSRAYYRLAYKPSERFDSKFHKVEVRVRRSGIRVYTAEGYYAREDRNGGTATKEEAIMAAVTSPLARRDLDVSADLQYTFGADNQAQLEINAFINATKLKFKQTEAGKYQNSFDVVGVVFDQLGRSRGGISQTVNTDFSEENYQRAITAGISYTANTQLPPGYYQVRLVVREADTGNIGSVSRYFEVPDLTNKRLTMSSIRLYGVRPAADAKVAPEQLPAVRVVSRKQDLRYAAIIYNAKMDNNKPQVNSRLIISQGGKILFQEPAQSVETPVSAGQLVRVGQLALAKVTPGRYVLTLIITDPLADKKNQTVSRSIDFTVVN
jgi:VWFA-related protein